MAKPMYVRFEMPKDLVDKTYQSIELAKESGKVRKGTNEVTKLVERGEAQFVVMAEDVQPEEILAHMPLLCEEKGVPYAYVPANRSSGSRWASARRRPPSRSWTRARRSPCSTTCPASFGR